MKRLQLLSWIALVAACGGSPEQVTATIGPGGGSLGASDGSFRLTFPPGAVDVDTQVTITRGAEDRFLPGTSWEIDSGGALLAMPATVELTYDPSDVPAGASPTLARAARGGGDLESIETTVDANARVLRTSLSALKRSPAARTGGGTLVGGCITPPGIERVAATGDQSIEITLEPRRWGDATVLVEAGVTCTTTCATFAEFNTPPTSWTAWTWATTGSTQTYPAPVTGRYWFRTRWGSGRCDTLRSQALSAVAFGIEPPPPPPPPPPPLEPPADASVTASPLPCGGFTVTMTAARDEYWELERSGDGGSTWTSVHTHLDTPLDGGPVTLRNRDLPSPGGSYLYRARASNTAGTTGWVASAPADNATTNIHLALPAQPVIMPHGADQNLSLTAYEGSSPTDAVTLSYGGDLASIEGPYHYFHQALGHATGAWLFRFSVAADAPVPVGTVVHGTVTAAKNGDPSQTCTEPLDLQVGTVVVPQSCALSLPTGVTVPTTGYANVGVGVTRTGVSPDAGVTLAVNIVPLDAGPTLPNAYFIPPTTTGSGASMLVYANGVTSGSYRADVTGTIVDTNVTCTRSTVLRISTAPQ